MKPYESTSSRSLHDHGRWIFRSPRRAATVVRPTALIAVAVMLGACSDGEPSAAESGSAASQPPPAGPTESLVPSVTATAQLPPEFDGAAALDVVEYLADEVGPREGTSSAFHQAAAWVEEQFDQFGYDVAQSEVPVPTGDSSYRPEWGTVVEAGTSANVIADSDGFDQSEPHLVIGAHLDTVGVAPGAEDNASGVGVMLELARLAAQQPPPLPVRFIAFGAEEPRGSGDDMHHFGSQQYVRDLPTAHRAPVVAMVALDRVGVTASSVPICTGGTGTTEVMDALVAAADDAGIDTQTCQNRASDHWSFEKADIPAARLGSVPYAGYHSPDDVPSAVDAVQLDRVGTIVWTWLQTGSD